MQRTKPILKLLENAKPAFSLIDFTASHSNQNHYSQTLRILSGYKWFDLSNNNNNNDLLTDLLDGSSLLNYINYNYKINQIKLFTNYAVKAGLSESNYSTD